MIRKPNADGKRGVALIIVIFAMMLFACLGWTLAIMQSADFNVNLRNSDSEQALSLSDGGINWSLNQLRINSGWRTTTQTSCGNGAWSKYSLNPGRYSVCCRNPTASEILLGANAVIECAGYMPTSTDNLSSANPLSPSDYRTMREAKMLVRLGSFSNILLANSLFNWTSLANNSKLQGSMEAYYFEGGGDANYNEVNIDWASTQLPYGGNSDQRIADGPWIPPGSHNAVPVSYPAITAMSIYQDPVNSYEAQAGGNTWAPSMTAAIKAISNDGTNTTVQVDQTIFIGGSWINQGLRNISRGTWKSGNYGVINSVIASDTIKLTGVLNWSVGDRVTVAPQISSISHAGLVYTVGLTCFIYSNSDIGNVLRNFTGGTWNCNDWGVITAVSHPGGGTSITVNMDEAKDNFDGTHTYDAGGPVNMNKWQVGDFIGDVERYRTNVNSGGQGALYYIKSDVLFDVRNKQSWEANNINGNINFKNTALAAEGDIAIKGTNRIQFSNKPTAFANLLTQNGNIYSPDVPGGNNNNQRSFGDLIYTQTGDITFNYLNGISTYGNNITFSGNVNLNYNNRLSQLTGFTWGLSSNTWEEE